MAPPEPPPVRPPAPRAAGHHTWMKIILGVTGPLLVLCCTGTVVICYVCVWVPVHAQYPATLTAPDQIAGLSRLVDQTHRRDAGELAADLKKGAHASSTIAGYYARNASDDPRVLVLAATALILSPGAELDRAFDRTSTGATTVSGVRTVSAGTLGGVARCGTGTTQVGETDASMALCGWADRGSVGIVACTGSDPVAECATLLLTIREAVLHRG